MIASVQWSRIAAQSRGDLTTVTSAAQNIFIEARAKFHQQTASKNLKKIDTKQIALTTKSCKIFWLIMKLSTPDENDSFIFNGPFFILGQVFNNKIQSTLHCIALHCITLHYIALHCITLHYIALHCITLHYIALHCITLHYIALHCITLHYIALHCITLHYIALHCITLHYIALHCITLHYIALHCITLHYIALHCITLHYIATLLFVYM